MSSLSPLGDVTRFLMEPLHHEAVFVTSTELITCSGLLLAARSPQLHKRLLRDKNIAAIEYSKDIAGLRMCLELVYGGTITITMSNFKAIYKFGVVYGVEEMKKLVMTWVANDVTAFQFWDVYLELVALNVDVNSVIFVDCAADFMANDAEKFFAVAAERCRANASLLPLILNFLMYRVRYSHNNAILNFMMGLLSSGEWWGEGEREERPQEESGGAGAAGEGADGSHGEKKSYTQELIVATILRYIGEVFAALENSTEIITLPEEELYMEAFRVLHLDTSDVGAFRRLGTLQNDLYRGLLERRELGPSSLDGISRDIIARLTDGETPFWVIYNFTTTSTRILPYITLEIVLKWLMNRARRHGNPAMSRSESTFPLDPLITKDIPKLFRRFRETCPQWMRLLFEDYRFSELGVPSATEDYIPDNPDHPDMLPVFHRIHLTHDHNFATVMKLLHGEKIHLRAIYDLPLGLPSGELLYNENCVPGYRNTPHNDHWFLQMQEAGSNCKYYVSLVTETAREIEALMSRCCDVFLFHVRV